MYRYPQSLNLYFQKDRGCKMPKGKDKYRQQKYRKEWEEESWSKGWLSTSKQFPGKAFCKDCKKDIVPGKSELQNHVKSAAHIKNRKAVTETVPLQNFVSV